MLHNQVWSSELFPAVFKRSEICKTNFCRFEEGVTAGGHRAEEEMKPMKRLRKVVAVSSEGVPWFLSR